MLSELLQNLLMLPKFNYLAWLPATIVTHPVEYGRKHQMQLQQGTDPCCGGAWLACSSVKQRTEKLLMTRKKISIYICTGLQLQYYRCDRKFKKKQQFEASFNTSCVFYPWLTNLRCATATFWAGVCVSYHCAKNLINVLKFDKKDNN